MKNRAHVLVVGTDRRRLARLAGTLVGESDAVSFEFLASREAAVDRLRMPEVDGIACEVTHGTPNTDEFLAPLREAARSVPVVLFGEDGPTLESTGVDATDTVVVGPNARGSGELLASVEAAVGGDRDQSRPGAWYEALLGSTSDVVLVLDAEGTIEYVSPSAHHVFGYDPLDVVGNSVFEYVGEESREAATDEFLQYVAEDAAQSVSEFGIEPADGGTRVVEARGYDRLDAGPITGYVISVRDVTERKRREQELAEYERIVETAPIGLTTLGPDGRITWANEVYAETLDIPREELAGTPFLELVEAGYYGEGVVEEYFERVRHLLSSSTDADRASHVVRTHPPGGETMIHDVYTALLPLADGEFDGTVSAFRDVTTQRAYEREPERQNERLEEFASVVSHDLRDPLSVAEAYLGVALETGDRGALETVADAHERMDALVGDLLTLARNGQTVEDPTPTDVAAVARRAWTAVETGGATLEIGDVPHVLADSTRLQQGFENLFRNSVEHGSTSPHSQAREDSVEHGGAGGRDGDEQGRGLTVTVGPLDDGRGFFVADDGRGIPADERERVFERGYTTDPDGTGFGLAIVETIVEAHGWSVTAVESEDGGVRFEITGAEHVA